MDILLGWTRLDKDVTVYNLNGDKICKLFRTYGIKILEIRTDFVKAWSPDMNEYILIMIKDLKND